MRSIATLILGGAAARHLCRAAGCSRRAGALRGDSRAWDDDGCARIAATAPTAGHVAHRRGAARWAQRPPFSLDDGADVGAGRLSHPAGEQRHHRPCPRGATRAGSALDRNWMLLAAAYEASGAAWFVVSNEVGLGIVPAYPLGRVSPAMRWAAPTSAWPRSADRVIFMVAGPPMTVK